MSGSAVPMRRNLSAVRISTVRSGRSAQRTDRLAGEEPMEIRAGGPDQDPISIAVTMRTPGNDFELAAGFLYTEGLIGSGDIVRIAYCDTLETEQLYNVVTVRLTHAFDASGLSRNFYATSSCGICGKASLEAIATRCEALPPGPRIAAEVLVQLPDALRASQRVFEATGGLHAAGLFDPSGVLKFVREDIGRHNAVDKVIGRALLGGELPLMSDRLLVVSGRIGFEIVQKAAAARIPIIAAVSAPSSLAVEAARDLNMTLAGFVRGASFNVYSTPERIAMDQ